VFGFDFTSTRETRDQCLRVKWSQKVKDAQVEGDDIPKDQRESFEVFLKQGSKIITLWERGSLWCC
jgi:hypothetical protein